MEIAKVTRPGIGVTPVPDKSTLEATLRRVVSRYGHESLIIHAAGMPDGSGRRWESRTLEENGDWRYAVLAVGPNATIPLHDHPGASGAHLVLNGCAVHHQFTVLGQDRGAWVLRRVRRDTDRLLTGDKTRFFPDEGNVHGIVAGSDGCVLLSIRHRTGEPGHWYSPINDIASQTVVAARFRRKRHQPRDSLG